MTTTAHLDRAMSGGGYERTVRHDPHDVWEVLGRLYVAHTGQSMTVNQAARLAMAAFGFRPAPRYAPVDIAHRLAAVQADLEDALSEVSDG